MSATFAEELTAAHARGDEERLNELLDMRLAVKKEIRERIDAINTDCVDLVHQLKALSNLLDRAQEFDMDTGDGEAPTLKLTEAANALQDWFAR